MAVFCLADSHYRVYALLYVLFPQTQQKQVKRIDTLTKQQIKKDDKQEFAEVSAEDEMIASQAVMLGKLSDSHIYGNTDIRYFPLGEQMFVAMVEDLKKPKSLS